MKTLKWIGQALGGRRWLIALLCVIQSALAISGIVFALLMRRAIDCAVSGEMTAFYQSAVSIAILIFMQIGMGFLRRKVKIHSSALRIKTHRHRNALDQRGFTDAILPHKKCNRFGQTQFSHLLQIGNHGQVPEIVALRNFFG